MPILGIHKLLTIKLSLGVRNKCNTRSSTKLGVKKIKSGTGWDSRQERMCSKLGSNERDEGSHVYKKGMNSKTWLSADVGGK